VVSWRLVTGFGSAAIREDPPVIPRIGHKLSEEKVGNYLHLDDGRQHVCGTVGVSANLLRGVQNKRIES
jgi:hypothetical protein